MSQFYRAIRLILTLTGFVLGLAVSLAVFFARRMIAPPRERLWATPADVGLSYQDIQFPARDGVRLSGWFVPAAADGPRPTVVLVHGWPWNRLGTAAESLMDDLSGAWPVELLRLLHALQQAGYHVLTFDLRNHGQSAAAPPVTFGLVEANDLLGALDYVCSHSQVDPARIGVVGFSMGANTLLYTLPRTKHIRAAVAVQPISVSSFARRYGYDLVGPLSHLVLPLTELIYRFAGGLQFSSLDPIFAASGAGDTPVLYIQAAGDRWGGPDYVTQVAALTPGGAEPLLVESQHRFDGYQYLLDNPEVVLGFFESNW
jgi:uncharacterized protein